MKEQKGKTAVLPDELAALLEAGKHGAAIACTMLAKSKAGHDKGTLYVVLYQEGEWLYLADGCRRTLDRPKKKKRMHVQPVTHLAPQLQDAMCRISQDAHIRRIIKQYRESISQTNPAEIAED